MFGHFDCARCTRSSSGLLAGEAIGNGLPPAGKRVPAGEAMVRGLSPLRLRGK
jgi:hypothetical protein